MGNQHGLPDFVRAPNQGLDPELYEIENLALDLGEPGLGCVGCFGSVGRQEHRGFGLRDGVLAPPLRQERPHGHRGGNRYQLAGRGPGTDRRGRGAVIHARFAYFFPSATNDCTAGLAEALRVLRPGGSLIVIDNDHRHGEFAALLARSSRAGSQGHDEYIRRWWAQAGAQRHEVMSSWRFQTPEELGRVLSMEFGREAVEPWLQQNPERTELSYGYVLHHLRRGA